MYLLIPTTTTPAGGGGGRRFSTFRFSFLLSCLLVCLFCNKCCFLASNLIVPLWLASQFFGNPIPMCWSLEECFAFQDHFLFSFLSSLLLFPHLECKLQTQLQRPEDHCRNWETNLCCFNRVSFAFVSKRSLLRLPQFFQIAAEQTTMLSNCSNDATSTISSWQRHDHLHFFMA